MKVAILSPVYPYRGGVAQFTGMLYQVLAKEYETKVFSFTRLYPAFLFPGKTQYVEDEGRIEEINTERVLDSMNPFSYKKTARAILDYQPDILIIASWMSFFAPAYSSIAKRLKGKVEIITLVHNAIPHEPKFFDKPLLKRFFRLSDSFVALSETVKNDILSLVPDAKIALLPHPIYNHFGDKIEYEEAQSQLYLEKNKKTLLFFGLIRDYKGLDLLIEAMDKLDDSYQLIIAGECYGSFEKYQSLIDVSSAKDRIKVFNQYIKDEDVALFFSAIDLLVLPYKSATQSGVIPVAYHFEVPILATDVGGLRDTLEEPDTGLICKAEVDSIVAGIEMFFSSSKETFIENIRKEKEKLSWDVFAKTIIDNESRS